MFIPSVSTTDSLYYLPTGWNNAWINAKQQSGNRQVNVVFIGDSIMAGWNASDMLQTSFYGLIRNSLISNNANRLCGDHYPLVYSSTVNDIVGGPGTATYPLTVNGVNGTNYLIVDGAYSNQILNLIAQDGMVVCNPLYPVIGFDIVYMDYNAGSWTYQIDGGGANTVTTTGPNTNDGATIKKLSITGLPLGNHTLTINALATVQTCIIIGITTYIANTGIAFCNNSWPGMGLYNGPGTNQNLWMTASAPPDRISLYQGYQGTTAAPTALSGFGFPAQPDLAIIGFGVNDAGMSTTRPQFRDALTRLVQSINYGKNNNVSIIIAAMWCADGTLASSTTVANQDQTSDMLTFYHDIQAAMLEVAQSYNCAYVNIHSLFGQLAITNGYIGDPSSEHPTDLGHKLIANTLLPIL